MGGPTFVNKKVVHIFEKKYYNAELWAKVWRRLLPYAFKLILTNTQSELIIKSAVICTQRWTNSTALGTDHSKMGGTTFVNEKVVHILEKQNNIMLNFETKVRRRLLLYAFKLSLTNIQSELIDKSSIISTRRGTNSLGRAHSKWVALLLSMKK